MAIVCLAKVSPLNPATGSRVDLYLSSAQDRSVTGLNGVVWEPAMTASPTLSINLWQGDFRDPVDTGGASFGINMGILKMTYAGCDAYNWAGAPVEIYAEESGTAWPWTRRFKGRIASYSRRVEVLTINASIDLEPFDKDVLTDSYEGTGGAEGGSDLKGRLKPLVIGWAKNVEPVLINAVDNVYQFSGYGPIEEVTYLFERAADFGASVGDYANYTALVAAAVPPGRWATCLAQGMVRLGAPAAGVITGEIKGHKVSTATPRLTGAVISALATLAGVSSGDIESSTLAALDSAVPFPINLVLTDQAKWREVAAELALACNWQSGITLDGKWFALEVSLSGSEVITLNAQGRALPQVVSSDEADVSVPYHQTILGAARNWRVQSSDEIAFAAPLIERGDYSDTETYREGNIVSLPDGSRWVFVGALAQAGVEPGTDGAVWQEIVAAPVLSKALTLVADREYITFDGTDALSPTTQTTTFTAVKQNTTAAVTWVLRDIAGTVKVAADFLSGTGTDTVTMTAANWDLARGSTRGVIVEAQIFDGTTYVASKTLVKVKDGATGAAGVSGVLTPQTVAFPADVDGNVTSFSHGAGIFRVYSGGVEVTSSCTFARLSQTNCTVSINSASGVYSVSAMSAGSDTATAVFRATYGSTTIDVTLTLTKAKAGTNAKTMTVYSNRQSIAYDAAGSPTPSTQTTTFGVNKQNTTATVSWTLTDASGVNRTPVTSFLSAATGDSVTMTEAQFASARNGTSGVIVRATITDGTTITGTVSLVRVQEGAAGAAGTNGTNGANGASVALVAIYKRSATAPALPSATVTYLFSGNNVSGLNNGWTPTIPAGTDPLYVSTAIASSTGTTDTISSGEWSTPVVLAQNGADGAAGANGAPGLNAKTLRLTSTRQVINYDDDGLPTPATQTTTFSALKQNTTATVNWSITDAAGVARTPVTSFLSASTGDSVTMTEAQFASARNGTTGVIVTASLTDGTVLSDTINVTRVQQGLPGVDAQILSLTSTGIAFGFNALGAASPSSQTLTFTANLQNVTGTITWAAVAYSSTGTNLGSITLSGTGNTRTMTNAQFMAPGAVAYAVVTATLGSLSDTCTVIKVSDGANGTNGSNGATGPSGLAAFLTNDSFSVPAYADGTVTTYSGATGSFKVFAGNTDVSSNFTLTTQANPQTLTVSYVGQAYTVTGGLDTSEDTASLTIRATGSGSYSGVTIDRVFSLGKNKGGYEIVGTLPTTNLFTGRVVFLTTDGKLYRYTGAAWTAAVPAADVTGALSDGQIAALAASKITGQLTDAQLQAIAAAKLTGQITTTQITDDAITTAKVAAGAVTAAEIAAGAVTTAKIAAGAITTAELAAGAVTTAKLVAGAVTATEIAAGAVTTAKIAAGAITATEIATDAITASKIAAGSITSAKLATSNLITLTAQIADAVITSAKIGNLQVKSANIEDLTVGTGKIANNAVTSIFSARNNTPVATTSTSTWSTVQQVNSVVLTGGPVVIEGHFGFAWDPATGGVISGIEAYILITNGTNSFNTQAQPVTSYSPTAGSGGRIYGTVNIIGSTTLPAGTYTAYLYYRLASSSASGASTYTLERFLSVMELKK